MFERSKLEAIAEGKKDFPDNEEEFAQWLEAVEDDQLYTRLLVRALVVNHQKAIETLAEGGVVATPEITREVEQIRQKKITETAERERKRIAKEQAEKKKKEQEDTQKSSKSQTYNISSSYADVPPKRPTADDLPLAPPLEQPARPPVGSTMDQAPSRASRVPGRTPEIQAKHKYERMVIAMVAALLVVNILSLVTAWIPKKQQTTQQTASGNVPSTKPEKVQVPITPQKESPSTSKSEKIQPPTTQAKEWEYRVVKVPGHYYIISSKQDLYPCEQDEDELTQTLNQYRDWELVGTTMEIETVHPNYGNDDYVTGLQPNTRTCSVILIFRKEKQELVRS